MTGQEKGDCIMEVTTISGLTVVCNYSVFYDWTKLEIQMNILISTLIRHFLEYLHSRFQINYPLQLNYLDF